jgi:NitT/TauT family transport system permease protein
LRLPAFHYTRCWFTIVSLAARRSSLPAVAARFAGPSFWILLIAAWQVAYRVVGWKPSVFPAPEHVAAAFGRLVSSSLHAGLASALAMSLLRLGAGFAIVSALAIPLGFAMARLRLLDRVFGGVFLGVQTLPSVCWAPLAVLTFGLTETGLLFVLVMGSAFGVAVSFRDGVRAVPPRYAEMGRMLGARRFDLYRRVLLPASLPALVASLRQGFAYAWRSLLGAEVVIALQDEGLGQLLQHGRARADVGEVVCIMILMVLIGIAVDRLLFAPAERRIHARFGLA